MPCNTAEGRHATRSLLPKSPLMLSSQRNLRAHLHKLCKSKDVSDVQAAHSPVEPHEELARLPPAAKPVPAVTPTPPEQAGQGALGAAAKLPNDEQSPKLLEMHVAGRGRRRSNSQRITMLHEAKPHPTGDTALTWGGGVSRWPER